MSAKNMYSETTSILRLPDSLQEKVDEAVFCVFKENSRN